MTQIGTRDPKLGNLVKYEEGTHIGYCRDTVTVNEASAEEYTVGTLLGFDGTDYKISVEAAVDGSEVVAAVVLENKSIAATTDTEVSVLVRGPAGVSQDALVLGDRTEADVVSELEALGIKVMTTV